MNDFSPPALLTSFGSSLARLRGWLDLGGPVVWVLATLGTLALVIVLLKLWRFAVARLSREPVVDKALACWRSGDRNQGLQLLSPLQTPRARIVACAMAGLQIAAPEALVREETDRLAREQIGVLGRYLRTLGFIASVSPLIGLLGTVIGMIAAFKAIETAGTQVDPALLSGGIWVALLTTAVGLVVAIPVSFMHGLLERRLDQFALSVSDSVTRVFTAALHQPVDTNAIALARSGAAVLDRAA